MAQEEFHIPIQKRASAKIVTLEEPSSTLFIPSSFLTNRADIAILMGKKLNICWTTFSCK